MCLSTMDATGVPPGESILEALTTGELQLSHLGLSDEHIMAKAEAIARRYPNFMSREQWQSGVARRMQEGQRDEGK